MGSGKKVSIMKFVIKIFAEIIIGNGVYHEECGLFWVIQIKKEKNFPRNKCML